MNKDYKSVQEIMKSNPTVKVLMQKFSYFREDKKTMAPLIVFEDLLENINQDFYEKCQSLIENVKSFFDMFNTLYNNNNTGLIKKNVINQISKPFPL